ncbi:MAG: hypothetical protein ACFCD0_28605 [Gemmataceae bacterium]
MKTPMNRALVQLTRYWFGLRILQTADGQSDRRFLYDLFTTLIALTSSFCCCGCSPSPPDLAEVVGCVQFQNGTPVPNVLVMFSPSVTNADAKHHLSSWAVTDEDGHFVLYFDGSTSHPGAVVGDHKVILQDLAQEDSVGKGETPRFRISSIYRNFHDTPLSQSVEIGQKNQFIIKVDPPSKDELPPKRMSANDGDYGDYEGE